MRTEQDIFNDLAVLCTTRGYVHAVAYFCFRDNVVGYKDELKGEDYSKLFSPERLIRTEISTLIGLMVRAPIDFSLPLPKQFQIFIEKTELLLRELHDAMNRPWINIFQSTIAEPSTVSFGSAEAMREPIFYGSESAYSFQYRDLAPKKYARDDEWLRKNKGFSSEDGRRLIVAILDFLNEKFLATLRKFKGISKDAWSVLGGFEFSPSDIIAKSGLPEDVVVKFLNAFSIIGHGNPTFTSLHEFNSTNAYPILKVNEKQYVLFQYVSLTEALYDTPFYWMTDDKSYQQTAMANRGTFTEEFAGECLERVFGARKVFCNVNIWESKRKKLSEIDALVLYADRAIVVQAKSKKLTLTARKGNDLQLKGDFKSAVQDACDQAYACSEQIISASLLFTDAAGETIDIPKSIKVVHPICLVSDHYPALSFQARQFLKYKTTEAIKEPLVCDIFLLDSITEMLESPLRCLSYLELRALAGDSIMLSHENTALGYHLKQNLWLGEYDFMQLDDSVAADLDVAMAVRRDGIDGERTPSGILTQLRDLSVGRLINEIENSSDTGAIDLGLELLKLSGDATRDLSAAIDRVASDAAKDLKAHDATILTGKTDSGITIHCNNLPDIVAAPKLRRHCELRKYSQRAARWFGIAVLPSTAALRFCLVLDYAWEGDSELDKIVDKMPKPISMKAFRKFIKTGSSHRRKVGRNELCPCGSGRKFKICCLNRTKN